MEYERNILLEYERNYDLGIDALVTCILLECERNYDSGMDALVTEFFYDFKSQSDLSDGIFIRRLIEQAWVARDGQLVCLAFDWAKVFDSSDPAILVALQRFGIPNICRIVEANYVNRKFQIRDIGIISSGKDQLSGIS